MEKMNFIKVKEELLKLIDKNNKLNSHSMELTLSILKGLNTLRQVEIFEYRKFDEQWLVNLESFLPSINKITNDIRSSLRYEEEILPIEKTRRTNPESVRHLLRNTRYLKEIDDGELIPEKILNTLSEIDYGIYENRFVMTLIDRLDNYLNERIEIIKKNLHGNKKTHLNIDTSFKHKDTEFDMNFKLVASDNLNLEEIDINNYRIYNRAINLKNNINRLIQSDFMKIMKRHSKVKPPILRTQIILKNPDFRQAYLLWLYLDREHVLNHYLKKDVSIKKINSEYKEELVKSLSLMFQTFYTNRNLITTKNEKNFNIKPTLTEKKYLYTEGVEDEKVFNLNPNYLNEFYLNEIEKIFKEKGKIKLDKFTNNKESLKQAILDNYNIVDQIINFYNQLDQDDDVFEYLVNSKDPLKRYDEALNKYFIVSNIREVKERTLKETLDLEKKWISEIEKIQNELLNYFEKENTEETNLKIKKLKDELKMKTKLFEEKTKNNQSFYYNDKIEDVNIKITEVKNDYYKQLDDLHKNEEKRLLEELSKIDNERTKIESNIYKQNIPKEFKEIEIELTREMNQNINKIKKEFRDAVIKIKTETNAKINETVRKREEENK